MSDRFDLAIVGGGIVGLATGLRLLEARPGLRLVVLEKESELATHQSGHNSGVVHAGLYYAPGSLKATLCREGKGALEAYAEAHDITIRYPGKLVVALTEDELPRLADIKTSRHHERRRRPRGDRTGADPRARTQGGRDPGVVVAPHGHRRLPGRRPRVCRRPAAAGRDHPHEPGGDRHRRAGGVRDPLDDRGELEATHVITCAGLQSDRLAAMTGREGASDPDDPRIVPFRGDYYTLKPAARALVTRLIYPVPDPRFPFLGVHFTPRHDGAVWAGPNAVLALGREGYRRTDVNLRDLAGTLAYRGFQRLAVRYWRMGAAEMWRDLSKGAYVKEMQRYLPDIRAEDVRFGPSGVRAQAVARDGSMVDDFRLGGSGRLLHVQNAPSPAATSSLAIGRMLAEQAIERFALA